MSMIGKIVWIKCRSTRPCEGNNSQIVSITPLPKGGNAIRYKCMTCGKKFNVVL